uniref:SbcC-like subunit of palindrome specific endonuclease n=1 Tax=Mammaliicoccus phage MSShimriz1 TaxID=3230127 RepID=A0AAU8GTB2_9VIRU
MVVFKRVEMKNFMAVKEATLDLDNRGLVLIEGKNKSNDSFTSNGASKTTLITSITYALYGKTEKGLKADEVVNRTEKKNTYVKLTFFVGDDAYRIERYRKDKTYKNKVLLFCNDKEITGSTNDVTDKAIQDLFGIEFNTYVNAIMYGQGDIPMFSQATDKGKKEILESITNVEVYKKAQDVAKEKIKEIEQEQQSKESDINQLKFKVSMLEEQYDKDLDYYNSVMEQKKQEEESIEQAKKEAEKQREEISKQIEEVKNNIPQVEETEFEFSDSYYKAQEAINKLETHKKDKLLPAEQEVTTTFNIIKYDITELNKKHSQLDTSDHCPVCGSPIDNSHKVKEQDSIQEQLEVKKKQLEQYQEALNKIEDKKLELESKKEKIQNIMQVEEEDKNKHQQEIQEQYRKQQSYYAKISELENKKNSITDPVLNDYSYIKKPDKEEHKKGVTFINLTIDKLSEDVLQLESNKVQYQQAVEAFGNKGIRSVVLDFITPFLNEKANEYLQVLSGSDISVEFQTQVENTKGELKDKFDVIVTNSNGGTSYKSNSAGEQKRIDLAISFAIQDLIMSKDDISTNIALYDECFDGLDTVGCENVIKLLKDRLKTVGTIFVITHSESLKPLFENVITMVKEDGVSRLEKENRNEVKN